MQSLTRNVQLRKKKVTVLYNLHKLHVIQTNQKTPRGSGKREGQGQGVHFPWGGGRGAPAGAVPPLSPAARPRPLSAPARPAPAPAPAETRHGQHGALLQSLRDSQEAVFTGNSTFATIAML